MKIKTLMIFTLSLLILFIVGCNTQPNDLNDFASCLSEKGARMFGAEWCPHCQEQKDMFGDAFINVDYTECTIEKQKCSVEEIEYLPTWKFADGTKVVGAQKFSDLAAKTGCKLI